MIVVCVSLLEMYNCHFFSLFQLLCNSEYQLRMIKLLHKWEGGARLHATCVSALEMFFCLFNFNYFVIPNTKIYKYQIAAQVGVSHLCFWFGPHFRVNGGFERKRRKRKCEQTKLNKKKQSATLFANFLSSFT